ncbi:MAG: hypothetical protein NE330_19940 [Lentisphaeraceae bacterium]|nr:hypothetical protein [Lentisphaeraceae bacterium]
MIYVIGGMKYSLTKTKAAISFSSYQAQKSNKKVALLDVDSKGYTEKYFNMDKKLGLLQNVDLIKVYDELTQDDLDKLSLVYDDIVIDSGLGESQEHVMTFADTYIVSFNAKDLGLWIVWSLTNIETMIQKVQNRNPELECRSFLVSDDSSQIDPQLIKVLKKSQYLSYSDSPLLTKVFSGKTIESTAV